MKEAKTQKKPPIGGGFSFIKVLIENKQSSSSDEVKKVES
jgi:hypothetical protein